MNDERTRRTGRDKTTHINLHEYCKHNKNSGVGQGEAEVTDHRFLRDALETEKSKAGLWRLMDKEKQE